MYLWYTPEMENLTAKNVSSKLVEIQTAMMGGNLNPHQVAEYKVILAGEYAFISQQLGELEGARPAIWNELRKNQKSDKATDRLYEAQTCGITHVKLKYEARSIEKMMSALSSILRVQENEARNVF